MKLLIIAGPYEADRLRKAAVSAGFEAVAVEPGESLSGWITASRPALIVMAPQMVHPDPAQALARVRSVPRGRVPIFFVGDAADEPRMNGVADGFFIRPVSPDELLDRARAVLTASGSDGGNGARRRPKTADGLGARDQRGPGIHEGRAHAAGRPASGPAGGRAQAAAGQPAGERAQGRRRPVRRATRTRCSRSWAPASTSCSKPTCRTRWRSAPRMITAPEGDREFDDIPTDDRRQRPAADDRRAALLARYALVEEGDYFEILGVSRDATADDVQRAHDRIARELDPGAIGPVLAGELGAKLDAMREVLGEALRVLGDKHLRPRYQNHLP